MNCVITNCTLPSNFSVAATTGSYSRLQDCTPDTYVQVINRNSDVTAQELWMVGGTFKRDNSVKKRSNASISCNPYKDAPTGTPILPATYTVTFPAAAGSTSIVEGYLRKNSSYGSLTLPTVTISGLTHTGSDTFTMTDSTDTWEKYTLSVTNTSGIDGNFTITFSAQSTNTSALCYFSGIPSIPFVTYVDHYGYTYAPTSVTRTVDPIITVATEATVAAYTGITIAAGTITLTSNHTIREIYDYCQEYRVANQVAPFFTSGDGINFANTYNLTLNGGNLTGTGVINMPTKTFTRTASETSSITINHSAGSFTTISVIGLVANSRIRIHNDTDNIELYNAVVAGTSVSFNVAYTAEKTIELRVTNVNGLTAYLPHLQVNTLSASGLSFLAAQVLDTVYNENAVNGSTVTECSTDYPNVTINVTDADNVTYWQRIYAWFQYATHDAQGIVYYFNTMTAQDIRNYLFDVTFGDLFLKNEKNVTCTIGGGVCLKSDGTTLTVPVAVGEASFNFDIQKAYIANSDNVTKLVKGLYGK